MKNFFLFSLSTLLFFQPVFHSSAQAAVWGHSKIVADTDDELDCIPQKVRSTLKKVADQFGRVEIKSGLRPPKENRKRGGAKGSAHIECRAIDFVYPGRESRTKQKQMASFLKKMGIRYNVYCSGRAHIDDTNRPNNYDTCL